MSEIDLKEFTPEQLQTELRRRQAETYAVMQAKAAEEKRIRDEMNKDKLARLKELSVVLDTTLKEMTAVAKTGKQLYYNYEIPGDGRTIDFSQYGIDCSGWDSSSC